MSEDHAYRQTLSLQLARVLDEIGLNVVTVERRRRSYLFREHISTTCNRVVGNDVSFYHFGSQTEGTTTPGLGSDLDMLMCYHQCNAIQDWPEWKLGKMNLLMLHEDTKPGYCRLQVLRPDIPIAQDNLVDTYNEYDSRGRVILNNSFLEFRNEVQIINGPARSLVDMPGHKDVDHVIAVKCGSWPRQADEFICRHRRHNWPSQRVLHQAETQGCFLVRVGHKLSLTQHLEWRISTSQTERCLMFSLNIVHIKVYVLLKMLVKSFVEPRTEKIISSYHCKTALFYCIESTESGLWVERNLLQCATRCLALLLSWVTKKFCPHFIISEENLFDGKITAQNRRKVQSSLRNLIMNNGPVLLWLGVTIDDLCHRLLVQLRKEPSVIPVLDSEATVRLIGRFDVDTHLSPFHLAQTIQTLAKKQQTIAVIRFVSTRIAMLKGCIIQLDKHKRRADKAIIKILYGLLGSMLASVALSHKMRVPRMAIQLLRIGATYDITAMLKLASVLYSNKKYRKVETLLHELNTHFISNMIRAICNCYMKNNATYREYHHTLHELRGRKTRDMPVALCVVFSYQEIHCAPPALRNEFFRSVGDDRQNRDEIEDIWMDTAVVDSLPYLYYLQYITYGQLGKHDLQKQSLLNLKRCIRGDKALHHLETAWNLLGQCMEEEQKPKAAMGCYMTSLDIRRRSNAANWHAAILCYKIIKPHL